MQRLQCSAWGTKSNITTCSNMHLPASSSPSLRTLPLFSALTASRPGAYSNGLGNRPASRTLQGALHGNSRASSRRRKLTCQARITAVTGTSVSNNSFSDASSAHHRRNLADALLDSEPPIQKTVNGVQVPDDSNSRVLFGANYSRLQRLKAQYDPEGVFSKWYPIIPNADA